MSAPEYRRHVRHCDLTYPAPSDDFASAWGQMGPAMTDHAGTEYVPVRGVDGAEYVAEGAAPGAWRIMRAGDYGLGAVTRAHNLKSAVQHLNAFHVANTCDYCGHVHSGQVHHCQDCGRRVYGLRYA